MGTICQKRVSRRELKSEGVLDGESGIATNGKVV